LNKPLNSLNELRIIEKKLGELGFARLKSSSAGLTGTYWFVSHASSDGVQICLRLERKPVSKIFSVHVGWRHDLVRKFVIELMQQHWQSGLKWLIDVKAIDAPSLVTFNLGNYIGWQSVGLSFDCAEQDFLQQIQELQTAIKDVVAPISNVERLKTCYLEDKKPFRWNACANTALRFGEAAALVRISGHGIDQLKECSEKFRVFIESHMFGLGAGDEWRRLVLESVRQ
jgi:hypothetical protein